MSEATKSATNEQITEFINFTGASDELARSYLARFDFEAAVQQWFDTGGKPLEEETSGASDPTSSFMSITGSTIEQATNFLQRFTNNVETAVSQWFETGGDIRKLEAPVKGTSKGTKKKSPPRARQEKIDPPKINADQPIASASAKANKPEQGPFILFALKAMHDQRVAHSNGAEASTICAGFPLDIVYYIVRNFIVGGLREFVYQSDFDQNGILYYLGTQMGIENIYIHPVKRGQARCWPDVFYCGEPYLAFGWQQPPSQNWDYQRDHKCFVTIELLDFSIRPNKYSLRHGYTATGHALRNWRFRGSNDGTTWTTIRDHVNDCTIGDQNDLDETGSFDVNCTQFFSYFQIVCSGNTSSNSDYLMMGGFEIYGFLAPRYV